MLEIFVERGCKLNDYLEKYISTLEKNMPRFLKFYQWMCQKKLKRFQQLMIYGFRKIINN